MKIICKNIFAREDVSDSVVCCEINEHYGTVMTDFLNEKFSGERSSDFYKLVDDNYKLYTFEP